MGHRVWFELSTLLPALDKPLLASQSERIDIILRIKLKPENQVSVTCSPRDLLFAMAATTRRQACISTILQVTPKLSRS